MKYKYEHDDVCSMISLYKPEFYLDMDCVLVDLERAVAELVGHDYETFLDRRTKGCWEMAQDVDMDPDALWTTEYSLVCIQPASFYANMKELP